MTIGTRTISLMLLVMLLIAGSRAQHPCVAPVATADESPEHQHHSPQDAPQSSESTNDGCDMYVPCGVSIGVSVNSLEVHLQTVATSIVEPLRFYYPPALPHETPPPRV